MDALEARFVSQLSTQVYSMDEMINTDDTRLCTKPSETANIEEFLNIPKDKRNNEYQYFTPQGLKSGHSKVTISESYLANLSEITVIPNYNILVSRDRFIIADRFGTIEQFDSNMIAHGRYFNFDLTTRRFVFPGPNRQLSTIWESRLERVEGNDVLFLLSCDQNDKVYAHWIWKILYEVNFAVGFLERYSPILIFTYEPCQMQLASLLHNFPSLSKCSYAVVPGRTRFRNVITCVAPSDSVFLDGCYHSHLRASSRPSVIAKNKIYVSRSDARTRKIVNEEELINKLGEFGFCSAIIGEMTTMEQALMFGGASHVVYTNGSHFTNLVYCTRDTKVCVIAGLGVDPIDFHIIRNFCAGAILFSAPFAPDQSATTAHDADLRIDICAFLEFLISNGFFSRECRNQNVSMIYGGES